MGLLSSWVKPGVGNIAYEVRNILQKMIQRLGQIGDSFDTVDAHLSLNQNLSSQFLGMWGAPGRWAIGTTTIGPTDFAIFAYVANTSFTVALPSPADYPNMIVSVKKMTSTGTLYVTGTVDGASGLSISTQYVAYTIMASSSTWNII
jgi:hypothetical protein